ncbi:MAG TPA: GtrA family protein [Microthrixaceae bacterium]|nr:GtrA family protein [Microthrixaceae bacterium]
MNLSPSALWAHSKTAEGRKQLRYAGISIVFVPVGQVLIQILAAVVFTTEAVQAGVVVKETNWVAASIASAVILTIPNFYANKYLVWRETSKDNLKTQMIVFWVAAMLGVSFATGLTYLVDAMISSHGTFEKVAVFFAQLAGFGIVWLARYIVLDKWIFKVTHDGEEPTQDQLDEMHGDVPI